MPYFDRNGMNIYYEYLHSNSLNQQIDAILIIHGAGMNLRSWDLIVPYLQQHYHILRYDLRGHELSDKGPVRVAWRLLFTLFLLERLNISSFFAVGHGEEAYVPCCSVQSVTS
ncbi:alpha/beta fold hydrolase [Paenibacillus sp. FSL F4-0236]|uniref:alpha/beta fold hydrolase n=1 Tax=unclassified Paenibacillus TaxID=185978 RepID=UPI0030DBFA67